MLTMRQMLHARCTSLVRRSVYTSSRITTQQPKLRDMHFRRQMELRWQTRLFSRGVARAVRITRVPECSLPRRFFCVRMFAVVEIIWYNRRLTEYLR